MPTFDSTCDNDPSKVHKFDVNNSLAIDASVNTPVPTMARSAPLTGMHRRQIIYELRAQMGAEGLHIGTNDLFELAEEIIRREETTKDGFGVDRDGLTYIRRAGLIAFLENYIAVLKRGRK